MQSLAARVFDRDRPTASRPQVISLHYSERMGSTLTEQPSAGRSLLAGFPVVTEISVLWGDEDAFGHVNNVAYLRWCETGRVEYFRRVGHFPELPPRGLGPILASVTCHYRRPLTYPDTVAIGTRVTRIGDSSFRMEQRIVSRSMGEIAAEAESAVVTVDYSIGKPARVPEEVRQAIARLEGRSFEMRPLPDGRGSE